MDPDTALAELRTLALDVLSPVDGESSDEAIELAEKFQGLDEWLSRGGFLPAAWRSTTRTHF